MVPRGSARRTHTLARATSETFNIPACRDSSSLPPPSEGAQSPPPNGPGARVAELMAALTRVAWQVVLPPVDARQVPESVPLLLSKRPTPPGWLGTRKRVVTDGG